LVDIVKLIPEENIAADRQAYFLERLSPIVTLLVRAGELDAIPCWGTLPGADLLSPELLSALECRPDLLAQILEHSPGSYALWDEKKPQTFSALEAASPSEARAIEIVFAKLCDPETLASLLNHAWTHLLLDPRLPGLLDVVADCLRTGPGCLAFGELWDNLTAVARSERVRPGQLRPLLAALAPAALLGAVAAAEEAAGEIVTSVYVLAEEVAPGAGEELLGGLISRIKISPEILRVLRDVAETVNSGEELPASFLTLLEIIPGLPDSALATGSAIVEECSILLSRGDNVSLVLKILEWLFARVLPVFPVEGCRALQGLLSFSAQPESLLPAVPFALEHFVRPGRLPEAAEAALLAGLMVIARASDERVAAVLRVCRGDAARLLLRLQMVCWGLSGRASTAMDRGAILRRSPMAAAFSPTSRVAVSQRRIWRANSCGRPTSLNGSAKTRSTGITARHPC